jgi:5-oxoprolinase (ATP-hydrolysing)
LNSTSTILVEEDWEVKSDESGSLWLEYTNHMGHEDGLTNSQNEIKVDPIELSIFAHRFMSIAEQMGRVLQRTAISTNIKERLDFSCAIFGLDGSLVANAPHIPVHLGSMGECVKYQVKTLGESWKEGEVILTNHPIAGGTHLPDMTIVSPVFSYGKPVFYVASRGHQSDIGGLTPGSMPPFSKKLDDEGVNCTGLKIVKDGVFQEEDVIKLMTCADKPHMYVYFILINS